MHISIHSLRVQGDEFRKGAVYGHGHFNPLPPRGGRREAVNQFIVRKPISIHSLRVEGDRSPVNCHCPNIEFQSTPSAWRETTVTERGTSGATISIHSLRVEGDTNDTTNTTTKKDFNPLPPRGGRLTHYVQKYGNVVFQSTPSAWRETRSPQLTAAAYNVFQSTPSAWRETHFGIVREQNGIISIHSLRVEGDLTLMFHSLSQLYFNPLPPRGGRPDIAVIRLNVILFQSTPSAWRETGIFLFIITPYIFQSTPSAWRETWFVRPSKLIGRISIHSLRVEGDVDR